MQFESSSIGENGKKTGSGNKPFSHGLPTQKLYKN